MKKLIAVLFVAALLFGTGASAETILFVTGGMSPPLVYPGDDGKLTGMDLDLITEFCKLNGVQPEFKAFPWKRSLQLVKTGNAGGIFTLFRTDERTEFLYYPTVPINIVRTSVWAKKGSGIKIGKLEDLIGKSVGVLSAYKYGEEFDNFKGLKKTECKTKEELIKMLAKGRFDVAIDSEKCFKFNRKKFVPDSHFEQLHVITENQVYMALAKKLGDRGLALAKKFDEFMKKAEADGTLSRIRDPYVK